MSYHLEGDLLEVCTCKILCPCWVGESPDGDETCQSINSWHIRKGNVNGVDVSNLTIARVNRVPGNPLDGNWKVVSFDRQTAQSSGSQPVVQVPRIPRLPQRRHQNERRARKSCASKI